MVVSLPSCSVCIRYIARNNAGRSHPSGPAHLLYGDSRGGGEGSHGGGVRAPLLRTKGQLKQMERIRRECIACEAALVDHFANDRLSDVVPVEEGSDGRCVNIL